MVNTMKRFVTRRKIKYKNIIIILIIIIYIILFISFKNINTNQLSNLFSYSLGLFQKDNIFYNTLFGFKIDSNREVMSEKNNISEIIITEEPLVYIYNTFQTRKYFSNYYNSYQIEPVITHVSLIFKNYLKERHIPSVVETKSVVKALNDNQLPYHLSYRGSRLLMEEAKENNPSLKYFIDFGISDDDKDNTTYINQEKEYARILFIIGTDNSNYLENKKLADALHSKLEKMIPGLSRGISLRGGEGYHGIYNQDFSNNCILIYVGGKENKLEDANRSLKILAQVFAQYVEENNGN